MTRENKLALVVGFGLFLFVGILISDHFSVARAQQMADLRPADDPLNRPRHENANLIDVTPNRPTAAVVDTYTMTAQNDPRPTDWNREWTPAPALRDPLATRAPQPSTIDDYGRPASSGAKVFQMPDLQRSANGPVIGGPSNSPTYGAPGTTGINLTQASYAPTSDPSITFHDVRANENLTTICKMYYNDANLVQQLAEYNDLSDPDMLRANHRLRIPSRAVLLGNLASNEPAPTAKTTATARHTPAAVETYTVKRNDTLTEIAQRTMGTAKRWRELYETNPGVIKDPNRLLVGTTLRIPQ
ncbi:MAG: LysM peptidoglycan-binding domain-containing protein [Phycisphaerales bacterium]|nr:LysM peptidoglycan-binding domain-containing protein [Phycisphaerales bacterium]